MPKMNSTRKLTNDVNPGKPTGPRTPEGKQAASRNATKHGAYSMAILALGETPEALEGIETAMHAALSPEGPLERLLVHRMVLQWWRLERAQRVERETLEGCIAMARYEGSNSLKGLLAACDHALPQPRLELDAPAQAAFHWEDGARLERVLRYEGQVERGFLRMLHELERLQIKRLGGFVPAPVVGDVQVQVSGGEFVSAIFPVGD